MSLTVPGPGVPLSEASVQRWPGRGRKDSCSGRGSIRCREASRELGQRRFGPDDRRTRLGLEETLSGAAIQLDIEARQLWFEPGLEEPLFSLLVRELDVREVGLADGFAQDPGYLLHGGEGGSHEIHDLEAAEIQEGEPSSRIAPDVRRGDDAHRGMRGCG